MIVNPTHPYHRADAPATFLYASVIDMCHWVITSLHRGTFNNDKILAPASYDLMWTSVAMRDDPPFREEMGLGWTLGHFEGAPTIGHGGGGFGWTCFLVLLLETNRGAIVLSNEESSAHERALDAVIHAMLGVEPKAGIVSWMIPVSQAIQKGGIREACPTYDEIKNRPDYSFENYELITLAYQLLSVKEYDMAIAVSKLNLHVFPDHAGSYFMLAKIYLRKNDYTRAETALKKVLELVPGSKYVASMLAGIQLEWTDRR